MMNKLFKLIYQIYFSIYKLIKYPTCTISTNFILPGVALGQGVIIKEHVKIYRNVAIGNHTFINEGTQIDANTRSIGKYCSISHGVKIGMGPHPLDFFSTSPLFYQKYRGMVNEDFYDEYQDKGYTVIGHDVFIAANAIVVAGVTVGDGAVIAAGAVVTKDIPPYAVAAGVPAKIIKYRFDEKTRDKLLESKWWDLDPKLVARSAKHGFEIDTFLSAIEKDKK
ncbi:acetyltransferase [Aquitalea sp. FJL05]|uniref:CatB-related O-acetyltransferase n=1 Tax=Aquitalea sp. FJL05 TaxID=2153366 RepID=UPI000F5970F6|nr:CatB-related O-acetyltransferase [Aquitalea sp. FJL05]RQO76828.1 acetyltransferase [Aquitalea sp. FJL05]